MTTVSIYTRATIEDVIKCPTDLQGCQLFEIWYRAFTGVYDVAVVYTRSDLEPAIGHALFVRRKAVGSILRWLDVGTDGFGFTEEALPPAWGKPTSPSIGLTAAQQRAFGGGP